MDIHYFKKIISFALITVLSTSVLAQPNNDAQCPPASLVRQASPFKHATLFGARWDFTSIVLYQKKLWLVRFNTRLDRPATAGNLNSVLAAGNDMFQRITLSNTPRVESMPNNSVLCHYTDTAEYFVEVRSEILVIQA